MQVTLSMQATCTVHNTMVPLSREIGDIASLINLALRIANNDAIYQSTYRMPVLIQHRVTDVEGDIKPILMVIPTRSSDWNIGYEST